MSILRILRLSLLGVFGAAVSAGSILGDDWSGWRGTLGNGISTEKEAVLKWGPKQNILWRSDVPGVGRSSAIVVKDRVFLTTGIEEDQSRRLLCYSKGEGKLLWNTLVHQGPPGEMHQLNTTASSTPCSNGKYVFPVFIDNSILVVAAVDFEGNIVWKKQLGTFFSKHGFAASPVVFESGVIINGHQDGEAFVVMLDSETGNEVWKHKPLVNQRSFSTPVIVDFEGKPIMILTGAQYTAALDPSSGSLLWYAGGPSEKFVSTPSIGHGMVFSFGGSPEKNAMAVKMGGSGDVTTSHVAWKTSRSMPYIPSPILVGDYLHILNDSGVYTCLEPTTGKILHTGRKTRDVNSSPIAVGNHIYFFEDSGECKVIRNGADFDIVAHNELGEPVYSTPAVSDGKLFVRSETGLFCIGSDAEN